MKKRVFFSALIGGAIGAVATVIFLVILNGKAPMETKDLLSFVLSTVSIIIAALTVLGAVVLVSTWNDIDERTGKIVSKYEEQAKQNIDTYRKEKEAEIGQSAKERQEAIDKAGNHMIGLGNEFMQKAKKSIYQDKIVVGAFALSVLCAYSWVSWKVLKMEKEWKAFKGTIHPKK